MSVLQLFYGLLASTVAGMSANLFVKGRFCRILSVRFCFRQYPDAVRLTCLRGCLNGYCRERLGCRIQCEICGSL